MQGIHCGQRESKVGSAMACSQEYRDDLEVAVMNPNIIILEMNYSYPLIIHKLVSSCNLNYTDYLIFVLIPDYQSDAERKQNNQEHQHSCKKIN